MDDEPPVMLRVTFLLLALGATLALVACATVGEFLLLALLVGAGAVSLLLALAVFYRPRVAPRLLLGLLAVLQSGALAVAGYLVLWGGMSAWTLDVLVPVFGGLPGAVLLLVLLPLRSTRRWFRGPRTWTPRRAMSFYRSPHS